MRTLQELIDEICGDILPRFYENQRAGVVDGETLGRMHSLEAEMTSRLLGYDAKVIACGEDVLNTPSEEIQRIAHIRDRMKDILELLGDKDVKNDIK